MLPTSGWFFRKGCQSRNRHEVRVFLSSWFRGFSSCSVRDTEDEQTDDHVEEVDDAMAPP